MRARFGSLDRMPGARYTRPNVSIHRRGAALGRTAARILCNLSL